MLWYWISLFSRYVNLTQNILLIILQSQHFPPVEINERDLLTHIPGNETS